MTAASIDQWIWLTAPLAAGRLLRGWGPLHAWSTRRRAVVAAAIAVVAAALAMSACVTTDFAGATAAHAALEAARRELADAQRALDALPALKRAAASAPRRGPGSSADDVRHLSELAGATGIALVSLEPGAPGGQRNESFRVLKLSAEGEFARLRSFLRGLAHAPVLIVPTEATIRRSGSQLSLTATLSVFDALPSLPDAVSNDGADAPPDPFATNRPGSPGTAAGLRLAGLLQDRSHAIALIETPRGTDAVEEGGRIDGERVVSIAMQRVTLTGGTAVRVLKWTEDEQ